MEKFGGNVVKQLVETMSLSAMAFRLGIYQAAYLYKGGGPRDDRYIKKVMPDQARPLLEAFMAKKKQAQIAAVKARKAKDEAARKRGDVLVATKPPPVVIKAKTAILPIHHRGKKHG